MSCVCFISANQCFGKCSTIQKVNSACILFEHLKCLEWPSFACLGGGPPPPPTSACSLQVGAVASHIFTRQENTEDSDGSPHLPPVCSLPLLRLMQPMYQEQEEETTDDHLGTVHRQFACVIVSLCLTSGKWHSFSSSWYLESVWQVLYATPNEDGTTRDFNWLVPALSSAMIS